MVPEIIYSMLRVRWCWGVRVLWLDHTWCFRLLISSWPCFLRFLYRYQHFINITCKINPNKITWLTVKMPGTCCVRWQCMAWTEKVTCPSLWPELDFISIWTTCIYPKFASGSELIDEKRVNLIRGGMSYYKMGEVVPSGGLFWRVGSNKSMTQWLCDCNHRQQASRRQQP